MVHLLKISILSLFFMSCTAFAQSITFKGLTYNIITSSKTNQQWLDRNLGAKKVCLTKVDEACFGDYYQWGRIADGHEKASAKVVKKSQVNINNTTAFIKVKDGAFFDWNNQSDDNLWNKNSLNNICPSGFKVPTIEELSLEVEKNSQFLKLPLSGYKSFCNGSLVQTKKQGGVWSSSTYEKDSYYMDIRVNSIESSTSSRADAFPVRCIKIK